MKIKSLLSTCHVKPCVALALGLLSATASAEFYGELNAEYQYFFDDAAFVDQGSDAPSISLTPTWSYISENGNNVYDVKLFARYDENDSSRGSIDIRELSWVHTKGDWEFRSGIRKEFWGVAETQHLVDIINQTDSVDRVDGEVKLGQPMVNISKRTQFGDVDFFVLPYFRERTFAGKNGRFRPNFVVNAEPVFESDSGKSHVDYALRWSNSAGVWDWGVSYFDGTSRDPVFRQNSTNPQFPNQIVPNYAQIKQVGIDAQATVESWLYKFEAVDRQASEQYPELNYQAFVVGLEKTFFDIAESGADIGALYEYYDNGFDNEDGSNGASFVGFRLALNDEQSTDMLLGCDGSASICSLEGSRRIGESLKLAVRANTFSDLEEQTEISFLENDSYLQMNLSYFF